MNIFKEPLTHFILFAGLLFVIDYIAAQSDMQQIVISKASADFLIKQREDLELRTMTADERRDTIDTYIEDEILYNEAYKRGLDKGDSRMRRNMILKMRGLIAGEIDTPDEATLRKWYDDNIERFTLPETWTIQQVYFSDDRSIPVKLLTELNNGLDPLSVGEDNFNARRSMTSVSKRAMVRMFGPDVASKILDIDDDLWHGPFETALGIHYFSITGHSTERIQPYEQMKNYLEGDLMLAQTRERIAKEVTELRNQYEIIIETDERPQ